MTEARQSLLNSEVELSKTVSSQKSYEARTQHELQLATEHSQQMANENLQQKRYAEEMQNQVVQLRWEMSQAMAAATSRGIDKSEAHSATMLSGAGGGLPPNSWQWAQSTQAPQKLPPQAKRLYQRRETAATAYGNESSFRQRPMDILRGRWRRPCRRFRWR